MAQRPASTGSGFDGACLGAGNVAVLLAALTVGSRERQQEEAGCGDRGDGYGLWGSYGSDPPAVSVGARSSCEGPAPFALSLEDLGGGGFVRLLGAELALHALDLLLQLADASLELGNGESCQVLAQRDAVFGFGLRSSQSMAVSCSAANAPVRQTLA